MSLYGVNRNGRLHGFDAKEDILPWMMKQWPEYVKQEDSSIKEDGYCYTEYKVDDWVDYWISSTFEGVASQCGLVVLANWQLVINDNDIGQRMLKKHLNYVEEIARTCLGYSKSLITLVNSVNIKRMESNGYQAVDRFLNRRSSNHVTMLLKDLHAPSV